MDQKIVGGMVIDSRATKVYGIEPEGTQFSGVFGKWSVCENGGCSFQECFGDLGGFLPWHKIGWTRVLNCLTLFG